MAFRFRRSSRLCDDVHISIGDKSPRVTRLYRSEPERSVSGLRWQYIRDVRTLNVLIVQRGRVEHRVSAWRIRAVDINGKPRAVPHGDNDVALLDHHFSRLWRRLRSTFSDRRAGNDHWPAVRPKRLCYITLRT